MQKFLKSLFLGKYVIIIFMIILSLLAYLVCEFTIKDTTKIDFHFRYTENLDIDYEKLISNENIEKVKNIKTSLYTGSKISTYQYVEISNIKITKTDIDYVINVDKSSFDLLNKEGEVAYNDSAAKGFLKHLAIVGLPTEKIEEYNNLYTTVNNDKTIMGISYIFDNDYYTNTSLKDNTLNTISDNSFKVSMIIISTISSAIVGLILGAIFSYIAFIKYDYSIKVEYNNITLYKTPFHKSYFSESLKHFKDLKSLVMMAILLAMVMVVKLIPLPSGFGDLGISLGFIFLGIACMIYGPYPSLIIGILSDVIGFLIKPDGTFFIGYTVQSMLACFTYGMLFHKTRITFTRCLIARCIVNILLNAIYGSICRAILFGMNFDATIAYIMLTSLPKNIVYLLPQSLVLYFVLKAMLNPLYHLGLINEDVKNNSSFF